MRKTYQCVFKRSPSNVGMLTDFEAREVEVGHDLTINLKTVAFALEFDERPDVYTAFVALERLAPPEQKFLWKPGGRDP